MKKETKTRLPLAPKPAPHPRKNHIKTTQNTPRLVRHPHSCTAKNAPKRKLANCRKIAVLAHGVGKTGNRRTVPEFGECRILELLHTAADKTGVTRRKSEALCHNQSPRPPVSKAKTHSEAETGKQSENSASPNSRVLAQGSCTRDGFFDAKTKLCATKHGIGGPGTLWHL